MPLTLEVRVLVFEVKVLDRKDKILLPVIILLVATNPFISVVKVFPVID
jgi:hypothetical protein